MTDELIRSEYDRVRANRASMDDGREDEVGPLTKEDVEIEAYYASMHTPEETAAYEAYVAEVEAEQKRLEKIPRVNGCSAVAESGECEVCGKTAILYSRVACTLGYPGHPGAEFTDFHICEDCLMGKAKR